MPNTPISPLLLNDGTPRKSTAVLDRELEDETVLFDSRTNRLHSLNVTAAFIWQHCNGHNSVEGLATLMSKSFDVSPTLAKKDLHPLLSTMYHEGIIEF